MERIAVFPEGDAAGLLFSAQRAYCLDESCIEWLGEAKGDCVLPEADYVGIIFNHKLELRRRLLRELDLSCIQMVYFHNPFELIFDEFLEDLSRLEKAVMDTYPDDEDCALLSALAGLRAINLTESNISDQGLKMLCEIQSLESLVLTFTSITDYGLENLAHLVDLRELDLSMTTITDAGLPKLQGLKRLEDLRLATTAISDDSVQNLLQLQKLAYLDLSETAISEDGLNVLQAGLKTCQIAY